MTVEPPVDRPVDRTMKTESKALCWSTGAIFREQKLSGRRPASQPGLRARSVIYNERRASHDHGLGVARELAPVKGGGCRGDQEAAEEIKNLPECSWRCRREGNVAMEGGVDIHGDDGWLCLHMGVGVLGCVREAYGA